MTNMVIDGSVKLSDSELDKLSAPQLRAYLKGRETALASHTKARAIVDVSTIATGEEIRPGFKVGRDYVRVVCGGQGMKDKPYNIVADDLKLFATDPTLRTLMGLPA